MANTLRSVKSWFTHEPATGEPFYLLVGLGNPGPKYAKNRHNVGFRCIELLAETYHIKLAKKRFTALFGEGRIGAQRVILARPLTFMNDSGRAVAPLARWYKVPPERILVIHDDLDLPLGRIRVRPNGSSGGHRGINSIINELGSRDFVRVRLGIGRPEHGDPVDYVLGDFGRDQEPVILAAYAQVSQIVVTFLEEGVLKAMSSYNGA